ncbi:hypothetical protein FACS1894216_19930 [Synergistales bacterium]|nr:hypothetical protein FACS1894216_19930 [Synergistales bacterium]
MQQYSTIAAISNLRQEFLEYIFQERREELLKNKRLAWDFDLQGRYNSTAMLWRQVKFDIQAWDIQWYWIIFSRKGKVLFPPYSLSTNIGFDNLSTHTPESDDWFVKNIDLSFNAPITMPECCEVDDAKHEEYAEHCYIGIRDYRKSEWSIKRLYWFLHRPLRYIEMILPFGIQLGVWKR